MVKNDAERNGEKTEGRQPELSVSLLSFLTEQLLLTWYFQVTPKKAKYIRGLNFPCSLIIVYISVKHKSYIPEMWF